MLNLFDLNVVNSCCYGDHFVNKILGVQGSPKLPSHYPGQVDFPSGPVTFLTWAPDGQRIRQIFCQLNH